MKNLTKKSVIVNTLKTYFSTRNRFKIAFHYFSCKFLEEVNFLSTKGYFSRMQTSLNMNKFEHVVWGAGPCIVRSKLNKFEHVQVRLGVGLGPYIGMSGINSSCWDQGPVHWGLPPPGE